MWRILFNSDGDSMTLSHYPPPITPRQLCRTLKEVAGTQVDVYIYSLNRGGDMYSHRTRAGEVYGTNVSDWTGVMDRLRHKAQNTLALQASGRDPLSTLIDRAHVLGLAFWPSPRMNDIHEDDSRRFAVLRSTFKQLHPELLIGAPYPDPQEGYPQDDYTWAFDYACPEVRARRLALVEEVLAGYDVDGFELDFQRGPWYFKSDEEAAGMALMTDFVQQVHRGEKGKIMNGKTPEWVKAIPENLCNFIIGKLHYDGDPPGLFRVCENAYEAWDIPASVTLFSALQQFDAVDRIPGFDQAARQRLIAFIQNCQDPITGLFIDPHLDDRFEDKTDEAAYTQFRHAVSKYAIGYLGFLGAEALHPYSTISKTGRPDVQTYLDHVKNGDWNRPWSIGSTAGKQTGELFKLIDRGHTGYISAVCEGISFMLAQQNPDTGMWGPTTIPLHQQISGTLKVLGRLKFRLGMEVPYMDRLADSIIRHQKNGDFYATMDNSCIPRNVVEMAIACAESSDYRREELMDVLETLIHEMREYVMPDGGISPYRDGTKPVGFCGAMQAPPSGVPRGTGSSAILYGIGMAAAYLGWDDCPLEDPQKDRATLVAQYHIVPVITDDGRVEIVKKRERQHAGAS